MSAKFSLDDKVFYHSPRGNAGTNGGGIVYLFIDGGYIINNTAGGNEGGIGVVESGQIAIHGNLAKQQRERRWYQVGNSTHISQT